MTSAVIKAIYHDYKRVPTRKMFQLIFEVPIEQAPEVHKTFGEPAPDGSMWVAIARLMEEPKKAPGADVIQDAAEFNAWMDEKQPKPKRSWSELSRAEQAGIACESADFRAFLSATAYLKNDATPDDAANMVRIYCGVKSRSVLDTNQAAAKAWDKIYSDYQLWRRGAAA